MTLEEREEVIFDILSDYKYENIGMDSATEKITELFENQNAKQQSISFFKWYAIKMTGFVDYITKVKPIVKSEEIEQRLIEFEGATFEKLYQLFEEHNTMIAADKNDTTN